MAVPRTLPIRSSQPVAVGQERLGVFRVLWAAGDRIRLYEFVRIRLHDADFRAPAPVRALALSPSRPLAVLTVRAERRPLNSGGTEMIVAERPYGTFTRQVFLGETLDAEHIGADYTAGMLTLAIPVREAAKPRKVTITSRDTKQVIAG